MRGLIGDAGAGEQPLGIFEEEIPVFEEPQQPQVEHQPKDQHAPPQAVGKAGVEPHGRVEEAVATVLERRQADGRWLLDVRHRDTLHEELAGPVGEPNRWITLRALRILREAPEITDQLRDNVTRFVGLLTERGVPVNPAESAIITITKTNATM